MNFDFFFFIMTLFFVRQKIIIKLEISFVHFSVMYYCIKYLIKLQFFSFFFTLLAFVIKLSE